MIEARERRKEMHLTTRWQQFKRDFKMRLQHRIGGDTTGLQLSSYYDYDVAEATRLPADA